MNKILATACMCIIFSGATGQVIETDSTDVAHEKLDSLFISETEDVRGSDKVLHAEPLFVDLIRDLGARRGEQEWNVGLGMTDRKTFDSYAALVEYEFAPVDRLGLEIELPFSFYFPLDSTLKKSDLPGNRLNSLKLAGQYSFYVSERKSLSAAIGYIHEFEQTSFRNYGKENIFKGHVFNPFFVTAKRWGKNFHTLLYAGPLFVKHASAAHADVIWQANTSFHYMISGTRNFIGMELNKELHNSDFDMTIRPQMRVGIADNLLVGVVTGIPISREAQRLSMFLRIIFEPKHKNV